MLHRGLSGRRICPTDNGSTLLHGPPPRILLGCSDAEFRCKHQPSSCSLLFFCWLQLNSKRSGSVFVHRASRAIRCRTKHTANNDVSPKHGLKCGFGDDSLWLIAIAAHGNLRRRATRSLSNERCLSHHYLVNQDLGSFDIGVNRNTLCFAVQYGRATSRCQYDHRNQCNILHLNP